MKMVKVQILGTALEAALMNPKKAGSFEEGFKSTVERMRTSAEGKSSAEALQEQCDAVADLLDDIFGSGSALAVLGDETDVLTCLDALQELAVMYEKQVVPIINEKTEAVNKALGMNDSL